VVSNGVNGSAESRNGANVPSPPDWDRYERSLQYLTERNHNLAERIQKLEENDRVREELLQETRHESNVIARKKITIGTEKYMPGRLGLAMSYDTTRSRWALVEPMCLARYVCTLGAI